MSSKTDREKIYINKALVDLAEQLSTSYDVLQTARDGPYRPDAGNRGAKFVGLVCAVCAIFVAYVFLLGHFVTSRTPPTGVGASFADFLGWDWKSPPADPSPADPSPADPSPADPSPADEDAAASTTYRNVSGLVVGMMLGLVFGFLDNFGLFYGMDNLDPFFYRVASQMMASHVPTGPGSSAADARGKLHELSSGMMSGLGNTFSDLLGVFLGSAILAGAKKAYDVDPQFWPADVFAIGLGCLLGSYLPALNRYGAPRTSRAALALQTVLAVLLLVIISVPAHRERALGYGLLVAVGVYALVVMALMARSAAVGASRRRAILRGVAVPSDDVMRKIRDLRDAL